MTIDQLRSLAPRQRAVMNLLLDGLSMDEIAAKLGMTKGGVSATIWTARKRAGEGPRRGAKGSGMCVKGHVRPDGRRCHQCRKEGKAKSAAEAEGRSLVGPMKARIDREIWEGKRCGAKGLFGPCCLLLPCYVEGHYHEKRTP